ncbi:MAG TPA: hypothetical protein VE081_02285 [Sporichthyaceae bacterium]|nr:hypothetical protein [Sporichthyaceae bacterium]
MSAQHRRAKHEIARRRMVATALVTVLTPAVSTFGATTAHAADDPSAPSVSTGFATFAGRATADGVRARIAVTDYLIVEDFVDGGGPTTSATLDSLGASTAYSSLPYPGATGVAGPGLISTVSGKSVPSYPFLVTSQYPSNPRVQVKQPGYLMAAQSNETSSAAQAQAGETTTSGDEFGTFSTSSVQAVNGVFTSLGEARTRLTLGAFSLTGAVSRAQVTRTPDGKVTKTSSFEADSIRIGDQLIGVTDKGLVLGPENAPADPAKQLGDSFASSGVIIKFLPAVQTADSVLSSGLEISLSHPVPNTGSAVAVVSYIVGQTFAQADATGASVPTGTDTTAPVTPGPADAAVPPLIGPEPAVTDSTPIPDLAPAVEPTPVNLAPAPRTVDLIDRAVAAKPLTTQISFYPLLAALVPVLLLAAVARRFV